MKQYPVVTYGENTVSGKHTFTFLPVLLVPFSPRPPMADGSLIVSAASRGALTRPLLFSAPACHCHSVCAARAVHAARRLPLEAARPARVDLPVNALPSAFCRQPFLPPDHPSPCAPPPAGPVSNVMWGDPTSSDVSPTAALAAAAAAKRLSTNGVQLTMPSIPGGKPCRATRPPSPRPGRIARLQRAPCRACFALLNLL